MTRQPDIDAPGRRLVDPGALAMARRCLEIAKFVAGYIIESWEERNVMVITTAQVAEHRERLAFWAGRVEELERKEQMS